MQQLLSFIREADKLKGILRKTKVIHEDRLENSAEHSWHLAIMAMVLAPHSAEPIDLPRVLQMVIIHDLVEIDAGDCLVYDRAGREAKREREQMAADRLFSLLNTEDGARLRELWEEFESQATPEARFAAALDRVQPILSNLACEGYSWQIHGIHHQQVVDRNRFVGDVIPGLWDVIEAELASARDRGILTCAPKAESSADQ